MPQFERFFHEVGSIGIDHKDMTRYDDFINRKINDLLIIGEVAASENQRDVILPYDLPITKGLQQNIHEFERVDRGIGIQPFLQQIVRHGPLDRTLADETEARLPVIAGGLTVGLAHTFRLIDTTVENPSTEHWERAFQVFGQLL